MTTGRPNPPRRRRRRWPWIVLAAAALLAVVAAAALPALLDVERHRARIERALADATGWQVEIGALDFSVLRGLVLTVTPAELRAPGGGSSVTVERVAVRADLLPLLRGKLNIRSVELSGPDVTIGRPSEAEGWVLPAVIPAGGGRDAGKRERLQVTIERIELRDGRLTFDDRASDPPRKTTLERVRLALLPGAGTLAGGGRFAAGGSLELDGSFGERMNVDVRELPTELLHPWISPELVRPGGTVTGRIVVGTPLSFEGTLTADSLTLLAGEQPFETVSTADFRIAARDGTLSLESLKFDAGGASVTASGRLSPTVELTLRLPPTPLDATLRASRSVLPLPLDVESPGEVEAELSVRRARGELTLAGRGRASAALFRLGDPLPPARNVVTEFELERAGALAIRILEGTIADGPVTGTARLAPLDRSGKLTLDGEISDAVLGGLVAGMVPRAGERVRGATGVDADVALDLARLEQGPRAVGGRLRLDARSATLPGWDLEGAVLRGVERKLGGGLSGLASSLLGRDEKGGAPDSKSDPDAGIEYRLDRLELQLDFDRWPWSIERAALAAGELTASGRGTFDPVAGRISLRIESTLGPRKTAALVAKAKELRLLVDAQGRLAVPLAIDGPLLSPKIEADLGSLLERRLTDEKDDVKNRLKGLIEKKKKR